MVQIDVPAAFIASQLMLDVGRKALQQEEARSTGGRPAAYYRFLARSLLFAGAAIAPAGIYLLAGWPGWENIYWSERFELATFDWINSMLPAAFVLAIVLAAYGGHVLGYWMLVNGKERYLRPTYLGVLGVMAAVVLAQYPSYILMGTYEQYHHARETMTYVWQNQYDFGYGWLLIMAYFAATGVWFLLTTRQDVRRLLSRPTDGGAGGTNSRD